MPSDRVLVVEDDEAVRESLRRSLRFEGYEVAAVGSGEDALQHLAGRGADVVLLDLGLPGMDGIATLRAIRESGHSTAVLVLTARGATRERVLGLEAGADDYLPKPFALEELLVRVRALLRRRAVAGNGGDRLGAGDLVVDTATREVRREGRPVDLTRTEYDLLEVLVRNAGRVMSRKSLQAAVWGSEDASGTNVLDVYVGYLRRKTEDGGARRLIHTVRGVGYMLKAAPRGGPAAEPDGEAGRLDATDWT